jgi:hypothetical protein
MSTLRDAAALTAISLFIATIGFWSSALHGLV